MVNTKDSAVQPIAVGFQCCGCCGQPGRKRPTCSCHKKTGNTHQCLKLKLKLQEEQMQAERQERRSTRKWIYFVFAMMQKPEEGEEEEEEEEEAEAQWKIID